LCKKMVASAAYQRLQIEYIDQDILEAPMPDEYRDKRVRIRCNECRQESVTPFHVFGLKCLFPDAPCGGSYNTVKIGEAGDLLGGSAAQASPKTPGDVFFVTNVSISNRH